MHGIWGTMKQLGDHMGICGTDTNNFTHLGRVHFGGSGSIDGTLKTVTLTQASMDIDGY